MTPLRHLDALEKALAKKGFIKLSLFWRTTLTTFYASNKRQLVLRVGRRGGKSSSLCRVAVLEGLYGHHDIPPGDVGVIAIVSVSRDEAAQRLRTIKAHFDALGVKYHPIEFGIELDEKPIAYKVFTASIAGVSGMTCILIICDEVAKWRDSDSGSNPAAEVLASVRPTMATQPNAKIFLSSSPLGTEDSHAVAFDKGDTDFQMVVFAESWIANPTLTEADTYNLEPDEKTRLREYGAQAQASTTLALDAEATNRAYGRACGPLGGLFGVFDPASGGKDSQTSAEMGTCDGLVGIQRITTLTGTELKALTMATAVARTAAAWKASGITTAYGDQRESLSLQSLFHQHGIRYIPIPWTASSKPRAVEIVRRWLSDDLIAIPEHLVLKKEMLAFQETILPSGQLSFSARRGGHDDHVALLITGALAAESGALTLESRARQRDDRSDFIDAQMAMLNTQSGSPAHIAASQRVAHHMYGDDAFLSMYAKIARANATPEAAAEKARDDAAWDRLCGRKS